jgi:hypothetical protein
MLVGKSGKSRRTGRHSDQYSGWTSTISRAVLDASSGGQLEVLLLNDGEDDGSSLLLLILLMEERDEDFFLGVVDAVQNLLMHERGGPSIFSSSYFRLVVMVFVIFIMCC